MRFNMNENENELKSYVTASQMHKSMHIILCFDTDFIYAGIAVHSTRSTLSFSAPYFELQRIVN
jgi:23S rRNA maturation-related 3'-5' exoribonuclease YhaM